MNKTVFLVSKMDCPSEERLIRMTLEGNDNIKKMDFDIPERQLIVYHLGPSELILEKLQPLNFGAKLSKSEIYTEVVLPEIIDSSKEAKLLKILLAINGLMFFVEIITGVMAESMGLISDSFDMLADASVYAISLYAVGKTLAAKKRSAKINGTLQLAIGCLILLETGRRFMYGSDPEPSYMISISIFALIANIYCLMLLSKHKDGEVHMQASYICSSSDVIANAGVILAGVLVALTGSQYPDLIIGILISIVVIKGAISIFSISRA